MQREQEELKKYCEQWVALRKSSMRLPEGFKYWCMEDFLLQHGKFYEPAEWTRAHGAPKCCFANSLLHAVTSNLRYVEGLGMSDIGFITHHAWNTNGKSEALDSTWRPRGQAYFGVEFATGRAFEAVCKAEATVFDDWMRGFPLYRTLWPGEDFSAWKKPKLAQLVWEATH